MFNFFKKDGLDRRAPQQETEKLAKPVAKQEIVSKESPVSKELAGQPDFNQVLADLRELLLLKGGHLSPLEIEQVSGLKIAELATFLGEKQVQLTADGQVLTQSLEKSLVDLESSSYESWWRQVANKTAVKSSLLALMLILKFSPEAKALSEINLIDKKINQSEESSDFVNQVSGDTYYLGQQDFNSSKTLDSGFEASDPKDLEADFLQLEKYSRLELINYYETDKDEISADNNLQITNQFSKFLSKITPDNFDMVLASEFRIFGSSDERPTTNQDWQGSNEKLSLARIRAAEKVLQTILTNYNFENSGLNAEQIKRIQAKPFVADIPQSSNGPEKGVTYLTDLINPTTGTYYQPAEIEEIKKNDPVTYQELLKACRQVSIDLLALQSSNNLGKIPPLNSEISFESLPDQQIFTDWEQYKQVSLLVDNSPSMNLSYQKIADLIASQEKLGETNFNIATFSDRLNDFQQLEHKKQAVEFMAKMDKDGSTQERAVHSVVSALEQLPATKEQENNLILVATDEPLQGLTWDILQALKDKSNEKNCQVIFVYAHNRHGEVARLVRAEEIINYFEQATRQTLVPLIDQAISLEESRLARYELIVKNVSRMLENLLARDLNKQNTERLLDLESKLATAQRQMTYSQLMMKDLQSSLATGDLTSLLNNQTVSQLIVEKSWWRRLPRSIDPLNLGQEINLQAALSKN